MGAAQKAFGNLFENLFFHACNRVPGMAITRFPDGCRAIGKNKIIRVKTPCDWIVTYRGTTALLDTKTQLGDSFPHSKIESHQVGEMMLHQMAGGRSGYVTWFRKSDQILFIPSIDLVGLIHKHGSFKNNGIGIYLGTSRDFTPQSIFGA